MPIVTTHKGADFVALAPIVAATLLYPGIVTVLPGSLNSNVQAFLSLHKDLFGVCRSEDIDPDKVDKLTVVVHMYRQILNVNAVFGVFKWNANRCLVIPHDYFINIAASNRYPALPEAKINVTSP